MGGGSIQHPYESLRLFGICSAMEWSILPVAGGIYDQHPRLLDEWQVIFSAQARHQEAEQRKRDGEIEAAKSQQSRR